MSEKPITRISLPTHHPAVAGCKDGDCVNLVARKVKTEEMKPMMDGERRGGATPPPVNTDFHVTNISAASKGKSKKAPPGKKMSPVDYVTSKRSRSIGADLEAENATGY